MKCPEIVSKNGKVKVCNSNVPGVTGLQEILNFKKHLRVKHNKVVSTEEALEIRADSGQ